jgi:uncharacterized protein (TIRG00374 family)
VAGLTGLAEVRGDVPARNRNGAARAMIMRVTLGLVVGGLLVIAFLRLVNVNVVLHHLAHLRVGFALLTGVAFLTAYVVRALRWRVLLRPDQVSIGRAVAIYQIAIFINWLLPIRGGELAKSLLLRRSDGIPVSRSLATVSMDKTMDLLPAVALVVLLPFSGFRLSGLLWLLLLIVLAVIGAVAGILVLASWQRDRAVALLTRSVELVLPRRASGRVGSFIVLFLDTLLALIRRPRLLLIAIAYTAGAVALDALSCWFAFRAVGVPVGLTVVLYGYTLFNLAFILPTPPGQIGSNEFIGLLIFGGLFGVNRSGVGAMFLFIHPFTAVLMTCSGLLCLSTMGLTLRGTVRLARDRRASGNEAPTAQVLGGDSAIAWRRVYQARHAYTSPSRRRAG